MDFSVLLPHRLPAFADPKQTRLAATATLFGNEPKPCCKLPPVLEARPVSDSRNQRRCRYWTDPLDLTNELTHLFGSKEVSDAIIVGRNAVIQFIKFFTHIANQLQDHVSEVIVGPVRNLPECMSEARDIAGHHDTMLCQQTSDLVHQPCPV
jgi:hypothetical protein